MYKWPKFEAVKYLDHGSCHWAKNGISYRTFWACMDKATIIYNAALQIPISYITNCKSRPFLRKILQTKADSVIHIWVPSSPVYHPVLKLFI